MATTRLQLYNAALQLCGEPKLASLTENRRPRFELDLVWNDNWVNAVLEMGQWQFAARTQKIDSDPDIQTQFGYANAFDKPDDWLETLGVCSDERFYTPLLQYRDEIDYWFADIDPIYVRYVSNDAAFGGDLARWPQSFVNYAAAYGASKIILALSADKQRQSALLTPRSGILDQSLKTAKNKAAQTQPTKLMPEGGWNMSRRGRRVGRGPMGDGGSSSNLIG